jgi:hypothetical protein
LEIFTEYIIYVVRHHMVLQARSMIFKEQSQGGGDLAKRSNCFESSTWRLPQHLLVMVGIHRVIGQKLMISDIPRA